MLKLKIQSATTNSQFSSRNRVIKINNIKFKTHKNDNLGVSSELTSVKHKENIRSTTHSPMDDINERTNSNSKILMKRTIDIVRRQNKSRAMF